MAVPDIGKPACIHCEHEARPHGGCLIYDKPEKPEACTSFRCIWLVSQDRRPEERMIYGLRPDRSKIMMHDARNGDNTLYVHVDPAHPSAWRTPAILDHVNLVMSRGCAVHVIIGHRRIVMELGREPVTSDDGAAARTELRAIA